MDTIHETGPTVPEMPRFDDGMVNISEPMRILAQSIINEVMDAQADEACAEGNSRNGEYLLLTEPPVIASQSRRHCGSEPGRGAVQSRGPDSR